MRGERHIAPSNEAVVSVAHALAMPVQRCDDYRMLESEKKLLIGGVRRVVREELSRDLCPHSEVDRVISSICSEEHLIKMMVYFGLRASTV
eukprot:6305-Heterococcus_DN1.PRE.2